LSLKGSRGTASALPISKNGRILGGYQKRGSNAPERKAPPSKTVRQLAVKIRKKPGRAIKKTMIMQHAKMFYISLQVCVGKAEA